MSKTIIIGGLGPNVNLDHAARRRQEAQLLLGWSKALDTERISFEEYEKREEEPSQPTKSV